MLIKETGTGILNANTFVDADDVTGFFEQRGYQVPANIEQLVHRSMDIMKLPRYAGSKTIIGGLPFPRVGIADKDGNPIGEHTIPTDAKDAQLWLIKHIQDGIDLTAADTGEGALKRSKVDVLEDEWFEGNKTGNAKETRNNSIALSKLPAVYNLLGHYLRDNQERAESIARTIRA